MVAVKATRSVASLLHASKHLSCSDGGCRETPQGSLWLLSTQRQKESAKRYLAELPRYGGAALYCAGRVLVVSKARTLEARVAGQGNAGLTGGTK